MGIQVRPYGFEPTERENIEKEVEQLVEKNYLPYNIQKHIANKYACGVSIIRQGEDMVINCFSNNTFF